MPTYEYRCKSCGGRFEIFQSIKDDALARCPEGSCVSEDDSMKGEGEISRIVSGGAGVVFRGDGFYLTDYARKKEGGGGESAKSEGASNSESGTSTPSKDVQSGGSETKPAPSD